MTPAIVTAWENVPFTPPAATVPYQMAHVLFAQPDNLVYGSEYREQGIFQVRLMYPINAGSGAALARAELLRQQFSRGTTLTASGTTVHISGTPEIAPGAVEENRYAVIVRIRFYAHII